MANLKDLIVNGSTRVLGTLYTNKINNTTDTEIDYLSGTTSNIQDQLNITNNAISNCIVNIPQNIKLELSTDGTLTLKAGSIVTIPGNVYTTITITSDISTTNSNNNRNVIFYDINNSTLFASIYDRICSGSTDSLTGTSWHTWFDTTNNVINQYGADGTTLRNTNSFPLCVVDVSSSKIENFAKDSNGNDIIFNGTCFIDNVRIIYPGVKALLPDGFNEDGSLKNIIYTTNSLNIFRISGETVGRYCTIGTDPDNYRPYYEQEQKPNTGGLWYNPKTNLLMRSTDNGTTWIQRKSTLLCITKQDNSTTITDFIIRQPNRLATIETLNDIVTNQGSLLPNFDSMHCIKTIEFDTADSNWHTIFTRTNTETNPANLTDVLYFRMTVTGTSINQVIDYGVIFRGQLNYPIVISKQYPGTSDGNYTGSRYYRTIFPKNLNNGYDWSFEVLQNRNNNARHYKVEVFKTTSKITWTAGTATIFNSTYHNSNQQGTETNAGYHINWLNGTVNQSSWASNINGQLSKIMNTSYPAGEALLANQFLFMNNNKYYPATNKTLVVEPGFGIQANITAYNINNDVGWDRIRQKCRITSLTNIPHDTLARGNPCYFRCTKDSEGNIYSDNYIATSMGAGYVWYYVGTAESASVINIDTTQSFFITLDDNNNLTHINSKQISDKVFSGSISNCITEIPQNIKLELSNNVLTLKAGSVLTRTGNTYATTTISANITKDLSTLNDGTYYIFGDATQTINTPRIITDVTSGDTLPDSATLNLGLHYLTTDKLLYQYTSNGWNVRPAISYPICMITMLNGNVSFAKDSNGNDMIFNGACFIGHHAVVYPNIKALIPNGFNNKGSLNSTEVTKGSLEIVELNQTTNASLAFRPAGTIQRLSFLNHEKLSDLTVTSATYQYVYETNSCWLYSGGQFIEELDSNARKQYVVYAVNSSNIVTKFDIVQPYQGVKSLQTNELKDKIAEKQDILTFDTTPIQNSINPVTSGGIYTAINNSISNTNTRRNVGEIVQSTLPLTDAGLHLLDGSLISGSGTYSAFVTYMSSLVSGHSDLFTTEADWQATYTEYGVCGKFVYNSTDNTIRLPYITGFIEGTLTESSLGNVTEAGLPNITATGGSYMKGLSGIDASSGAISKTSGSGTGYRLDTGGGTYFNETFDASQSNAIYGNSTTVQPQSIKVYYYIVVANITKTEIEVDIDNIQTELNDTVRVSDLTEVAAVVETYKSGTDWYRVWSDGWIEQGGIIHSESGVDKPVSLLKTMIDTTYTVALSYGDYTANNQYTIAYKNKTTQGFVIGSWWSTNSNLAGPCNWYVCGY